MTLTEIDDIAREAQQCRGDIDRADTLALCRLARQALQTEEIVKAYYNNFVSVTPDMDNVVAFAKLAWLKTLVLYPVSPCES